MKHIAKPLTLIVITALAAVSASACTKKQDSDAAGATGSAGGGSLSVGNLKIDEVQAGSGAKAEAGKTVSVHYTGMLTNGTKFDSSVDRGQPFKFKLGGGQVIQGWEKGIAGMKVGGKRKLTIPPEMGYGERGFPPVIPPQSTLVFDVELLGVE